jgi:hypothetical protein
MDSILLIIEYFGGLTAVFGLCYLASLLLNKFTK